MRQPNYTHIVNIVTGRDLVELKQRLVAVWADFEQTTVNKAIGENEFGLVSRPKNNSL